MSRKPSFSRPRSLSSDLYECGPLRSAATVLPQLPPPRLDAAQWLKHKEFFATRTPRLPKGLSAAGHLQFVASAMDFINECRLIDGVKEEDAEKLRVTLVQLRKCLTALRCEKQVMSSVLIGADPFEGSEEIIDSSDDKSANFPEETSSEMKETKDQKEEDENEDDTDSEFDESVALRREIDVVDSDSESFSKLSDGTNRDEKNEELSALQTRHRELWIEADERSDWQWVAWRQWSKEQLFLWLRRALLRNGCSEFWVEKACFKVLKDKIDGRCLSAWMAAYNRVVVLTSLGLDVDDFPESQRLWDSLLALQKSKGPMKTGTPPTEVEFGVTVRAEGSSTH